MLAYLLMYLPMTFLLNGLVQYIKVQVTLLPPSRSCKTSCATKTKMRQSIVILTCIAEMVFWFIGSLVFSITTTTTSVRLFIMPKNVYCSSKNRTSRTTRQVNCTTQTKTISKQQLSLLSHYESIKPQITHVQLMACGNQCTKYCGYIVMVQRVCRKTN